VSTLRRIDCATATERAPLFVLGALDATETAEVREHLASCPEAHPEFLELGGVVPYLAELPEQVTPPDSLRDRVVAAVAADLRARQRDDVAAERLVASFGSPAEAAEAPSAPSAEPPAPIVLAERRRVVPASLGRIVQLAAVLVAGLLLAWNLVLQSEVNGARQRAALLRDAIVASNEPGATVARLAGTDAAPATSGFAVLPDAPTETGFLVLHGLGAAPAGKTYQAWFVTGDQPRSAGLVDVGSDGLAVLPGLRPDGLPDAVAVTLEPAGGSEGPTLPILAVGPVERSP
jgi:anti-sigma-K factor RskA